MHPKHPKKDINRALDYAESVGLTVERTRAGHKWGRIVCAAGHPRSVWSTPRSPTDHAQDLRRWADQHAHIDTIRGA